MFYDLAIHNRRWRHQENHPIRAWVHPWPSQTPSTCSQSILLAGNGVERERLYWCLLALRTLHSTEAVEHSRRWRPACVKRIISEVNLWLHTTKLQLNTIPSRTVATRSQSSPPRSNICGAHVQRSRQSERVRFHHTYEFHCHSDLYLWHTFIEEWNGIIFFCNI